MVAKHDGGQSSAIAVLADDDAHEPQPQPLHVYLVDFGWNTQIHQMIRDNLPAFQDLLAGHSFHHLGPQEAQTLAQAFPAMVGLDPVLVVIDTDAVARGWKNFGFRINLGATEGPSQALSMMRNALRIVLDPLIATHVESEVRREILKEEAAEVIEVIGHEAAAIEAV